MAVTYRFLTTVEDGETILQWFRTLPDQPVESTRHEGSMFYFQECGPLHSDVSKSPIANVFVPLRKRGVLTTIGEVHYLATPLKACPRLNFINRLFRRWLRQFPCVYSHRPDFDHQWDYFLEGSATNWDSDIFALPEGMKALNRGAYFVNSNDNEVLLDRICRTLEFRGVEGIVKSDRVE